MSFWKKITAPFNPLQWGSSDDPLFGGPLGDLIPGIGDARAAAEANRLNIAEADKNRVFQERMSSTAYQRAMRDMKEAGLNPMLAFSQGGASTPQGATAQITAAPKTRLAEMGIQSALGVNAQRMKAQEVQNQTAQTESAIKLNSAQAAKTVAETQKTIQESKGIGPTYKVLEKFGEKANSFINQTFDALRSSAKDSQEAVEAKAKLNYQNSPAGKAAAKRRKK